MQLPTVPGNWLGVVSRIDASTEEVKSFFDPLSNLVENYSWEVSIGYLFTRVEQAHNHLLRGAAVKMHSVNASTADRFVDGCHITRKEFSRLYKNVVGRSIPARSVKLLSDAEKIRDRVVHGKRVVPRDQRMAIVYIVEYAESINAEIQKRAKFSPFKYDQRGYVGRKATLPESTSAWVMKGLGFGS